MITFQSKSKNLSFVCSFVRLFSVNVFCRWNGQNVNANHSRNKIGFFFLFLHFFFSCCRPQCFISAGCWDESENNLHFLWAIRSLPFTAEHYDWPVYLLFRRFVRFFFFCYNCSFTIWDEFHPWMAIGQKFSSFFLKHKIMAIWGSLIRGCFFFPFFIDLSATIVRTIIHWKSVSIKVKCARNNQQKRNHNSFHWQPLFLNQFIVHYAIVWKRWIKSTMNEPREKIKRCSEIIAASQQNSNFSFHFASISLDFMFGFFQWHYIVLTFNGWQGDARPCNGIFVSFNRRFWFLVHSFVRSFGFFPIFLSLRFVASCWRIMRLRRAASTFADNPFFNAKMRYSRAEITNGIDRNRDAKFKIWIE